MTCIICKHPASLHDLCLGCARHVSYTRAWAACDRNETISKLIDEYKLRHNASALQACAELLDERTPILPNETIVVPVPTIRPHIRQRGYAHAERIAASFARLRGLAYRPCVARIGVHVQRGSSRTQRLRQARESYECEAELPPVPHLVIDDVVTTGATLQAVASQLRARGASEVYVAVVARQPRDEHVGGN